MQALTIDYTDLKKKFLALKSRLQELQPTQIKINHPKINDKTTSEQTGSVS